MLEFKVCLGMSLSQTDLISPIKLCLKKITNSHSYPTQHSSQLKSFDLLNEIRRKIFMDFDSSSLYIFLKHTCKKNTAINFTIPKHLKISETWHLRESQLEVIFNVTRRKKISHLINAVNLHTCESTSNK